MWQAQNPSTEILAKALYLGAVLGLVMAVQSGWAPAVSLAGLFVGIG